MPGREAGAVALHLRAAAVGGQHLVAAVDPGAGDPGVVPEDFPLGRQAPGGVEFHAGGVALARQQVLRGGAVRVLVALVVLLGIEHRCAQQQAFLHQLPLAADLDVAAPLRRRVGQRAVHVARGELIGVARGVVRGAVGHVVGRHIVRLVEQADARAPQRFVHREAGARRDGAVGRRGGDGVVACPEGIEAQAGHQLEGVGERHGVLHVQAQVARGEGVEGRRAAGVGEPVAVVRVGHRGGQPAAAAGEVVVAPGVFVVEIHAGQQLVLMPAPVEGVAVVALQLRGVADADAPLGLPRDDGVGAPVVDGGGIAARGAEADHAAEQVARVAAVAQLGLQLAAVCEAVKVRDGAVGGGGVEVVAVEPVEAVGGQRGHDLAVTDEPRVAVAAAAAHAQVVEADRELVGGADAPAVGGRDAPLVLLGAPVVGVVAHHVQTEGRVLAGDEVEIALDALFLAGADGDADFLLVHQEGLLADLVDHTAGGALAEQHRGRALDDFHTVVVEGVALVQAAVAHAVAVDVAGLAEREAAQAHVFLAGLAGLEGHAGGGAQHLAHVVQVAVVDELLGHHRHALRDVAQLLRALADLGGLDLQVVLGLRYLHLARDGHGGQGGGRLGVAGGGGRWGGRGRGLRLGCSLRERAHGASQQHRPQGQGGAGGCFKLNSCLRPLRLGWTLFLLGNRAALGHGAASRCVETIGWLPGRGSPLAGRVGAVWLAEKRSERRLYINANRCH